MSRSAIGHLGHLEQALQRRPEPAKPAGFGAGGGAGEKFEKPVPPP